MVDATGEQAPLSRAGTGSRRGRGHPRHRSRRQRRSGDLEPGTRPKNAAARSEGPQPTPRTARKAPREPAAATGSGKEVEKREGRSGRCALYAATRQERKTRRPAQPARLRDLQELSRIVRVAAGRGEEARLWHEEVHQSPVLGRRRRGDLEPESRVLFRRPGVPRQECLDWFHVVEKLWDAGKAICRGTRRQRQELEAWVAKKKWQQVPPRGSRKGRQPLHQQAARMRYKKLRSEDLPIASGVIEGTVRNLVGVRLDGPGMRWGRDRAEAILHLRCVLLNGQW